MSICYIKLLYVLRFHWLVSMYTESYYRPMYRDITGLSLYGRPYTESDKSSASSKDIVSSQCCFFISLDLHTVLRLSGDLFSWSSYRQVKGHVLFCSIQDTVHYTTNTTGKVYKKMWNYPQPILYCKISVVYVYDAGPTLNQHGFIDLVTPYFFLNMSEHKTVT